MDHENTFFSYTKFPLGLCVRKYKTVNVCRRTEDDSFPIVRRTCVETRDYPVYCYEMMRFHFTLLINTSDSSILRITC